MSRRRWSAGRRPARLVLPLLALGLFGGGPAAGGGTRNLGDAWLLPASAVRELLGGDGTGGRPTIPAVGGAPRLGEVGGATWVACGQGRLHGLPELPLLGVAAGHARGRLAGHLAWHRLGSTLYREESLRLRLAWLGRWGLGAGAGWESLAIAGEPVARRVTASVTATASGRAAGAEWRLRGDWHLLAPAPWLARGPRSWLAGSVRSGEALAALAIDRTGAGTPVVQLELMVRAAGGVGIGLRSEPATGTVGFTLAVRRGPILLRSAHLAHPALGATHRWSLCWGRPVGDR